ncbi:hypothetical protein [Micromonospora sp. HUAS LYJ1]|uniref:hypothetical protein n=1 Tax=Micromonospora sp. HUAS LYJ1 TaxID=3061626 RepID=UPI0026738BE9|nr:hypothetical protein [Micromonospora sp. HUAS LYJ1]WKU03409.1 hypothetical protein Q2K16_21480 [Micromonospora sp. HUAS LYJ1]
MHDNGYPFDINNRAYQRFPILASEHFETINWHDADTGLPTMITLVDIGSRDAFSLALLDTAEDHRHHALLAVTTTDALALHGPIPGRAAAADYAPHLAMHDVDIAATTPISLHNPDDPHIGDDEWISVPSITHAARTTMLDSGSVALAFLDRDRATIAVVGPFPTIDAADAWRPAAAGRPSADRLLLAVHAPVMRH